MPIRLKPLRRSRAGVFRRIIWDSAVWTLLLLVAAHPERDGDLRETCWYR